MSQPIKDRPVTAPSVGAFLVQDVASALHPHLHLWGFQGLHGGLATALLASAMREHADGRPLRNITAHFHRAITDEFSVATRPLRSSSRGTVVTATAGTRKGACLDATAVFGTPGAPAGPLVAPSAPSAPLPEDCEVFTVPPEFVPVASQAEIRPVGPNRPFTNGDDPELTAWIRLIEDDEPPDLYRLTFLMDALAPSFAAVLKELQPIPTVELSVRPADGLRDAISPWVLLHARTLLATADGWVDERIDAWDPDGVHLGAAQQLRLVRSP